MTFAFLTTIWSMIAKKKKKKDKMPSLVLTILFHNLRGNPHSNPFLLQF